MNKLILFSLFALIFTFSSCDDIIPDIEKVVTETYKITIEEDMPATISDTVLIDVNDLKEYQDYKQFVSGYALDKITYEIAEYDAPEDLYFYASILAFDTLNTTVVTVGEIPSISLFDVSMIDSASVMEQDAVASDQLISWLSDPGNFNISFEAGFEGANGIPYEFKPEDIGKSFELKVNFHLTIMTGFGGGA